MSEPQNDIEMEIHSLSLEEGEDLAVQHSSKLNGSHTHSVYDDQISAKRGPIRNLLDLQPISLENYDSDDHYNSADPPSSPSEQSSCCSTSSRSGFRTPPTELCASVENPSRTVARKVLNIIHRYRQNPRKSNVPGPGQAKFLPIVERYVEDNEPIRMVLPAFPFKTPNRVDKAIGSMPDLGEEIALFRLNRLCKKIQEVYPPGGRVTITSDGLVYNDLMGISNEEVWEYSSAIRDIIAEQGLINLDTLRIIDILGTHEKTGVELTKEEYVAKADAYRQELVDRFTPPNFDARHAVRNDDDICLTYRGYLRFLSKDLMHSKLYQDCLDMRTSKRFYKKAVQELAYKMIARGKAFAAAIEHRCTNFVRLSIHPSTGQNKLSIALIPPKKGSPPRTPWHASLVVQENGAFYLAYSEEVRDTHVLVLRDGTPYHWRERSKAEKREIRRSMKRE